MMRDRGWKWSQATVWSIERGERSVKLAEVQDLAACLNVLAPLLTYPDAGSQVMQWVQELARAERGVQSSTAAYEDARLQLQVLLQEVGDQIAGTGVEGIAQDVVSRSAADVARSQIENPDG